MNGVARPARRRARSWRLAAIAVGACAALASCHSSEGVRASGTIEIDEIDVSSLVGGRVARLYVDEGDTVRAGDTLAVLDRGEVTASLEAQAAQAERAEAQFRDLRSGPRSPEILAARAEAIGAASGAEGAEKDFRRAQALSDSGMLSAAELDHARGERDAAVAQRDATREQLRLLESGFRRDQVSAAQRALEAARAELQASRSRAGELVLTAPAGGVVLLRNFEAGEVASPAQAIVTLGDPAKLWMRIYVAAPDLPRVRLGAPVQVSVQGVKRRFTGKIVEIATEAEFTPRAALTDEERANLVFGVKVRLDPADGELKPGLPAEATISTAGKAGPS